MPLTPRRSQARSKGRGYLLAEVMVGGAMAAVVIAGILTLIADSRGARIAAARDVLASQHVLDKMEELRNMAPPTAGTDTLANGYNRTWTVGGAVNETLVTPSGNVVVTSRSVTVTVTYKSRLSPNGSGIRSTQATTRVYQ